MPTSNINALHHSLQCLLEEGVANRYAAYNAAALAVQDGLRALGFSLLTEAAYASPLTTAFRMRPGVDAQALRQSLLEDAGVMVSGGIGELKGKILRVGHIGQARRRDYVVAFLLGVESFLRAQGEDVSPGASLVGLEDLSLFC
jgi:aspartate aminotransferase-like enzyme